MIDFDLFLSRVMPYAPACPEVTAIQKIRDAAIEVCRRTMIWKVRQSVPIPVLTADYAIPACPDQSVILQMRAANFNDGRPLERLGSADFDDRFFNWREETPADGTPCAICQLSPDTVAIYPRSTGTLYLELILKPSIDCDELPDFLGEHYLNVIAQGAAAEILKMPARDWSNPNLAIERQNNFMMLLDQHANDGAKGQTGGRLRTRGNWL